MKKLNLLFTLLLSTAALTAQNTPPQAQLYVRGAVHQGAVRLRWIPANIGVFLKGNQYGYQVTRQMTAHNGAPVTAAERTASTTVFGPFLPLPEPQWDPVADTSDIAGVAQAAIYADNFDVAPSGDQLSNIVNTNSQNESRYGFGLFAADQSFVIAGYMGLAFTDNTALADPTAEYAYRVVVLTSDVNTRPRGVGLVPVSQPLVLPAPAGLGISTGVGHALLSLPRGELETHYSSFNIERSADGGNTWVRRNDKPLLFVSDNGNSETMLFKDTIELPGTPFRYRMRGNSPFGFAGPPSNVVEGVGKKQALNIYPNLRLVEVDGQFLLTWEFPTVNNGDIQKFQVFRSADSESGFAQLGETGSTERTFTDPSPDPLYNYYKVVAIDNGNNPNASLAVLGQLNDNVPPAVPTGLSASVDATGLVTLTWTKNLEADLKGYRVYFSNNPEADFAQITGEVLTANTFTHQLELKVLGKKVFYKIIATDFRENDSEYTASVFVERPDVIPPPRPILSKVEPLPLGVQLIWVPSSGDDVTRHEVQRRVKNTMNWATIAEYPISSSVHEMLDSTLTGTSEFSYRVLAFDQGGLSSTSSVIDVKPLKTLMDTIVKFKVFSAVEGSQKQAKLTWEYGAANQVESFQVYRSMDISAPHLYATYKVNPDELTIDPGTNRAIYIYRDKEITADGNYQYQVLAKYPDGSSSPLSQLVSFSF